MSDEQDQNTLASITKLTEEDIDALADKLIAKSSENPKLQQQMADLMLETLQDRLFINTGKGVWNLAWKGCLLMVVAIAVYGAAHGYWN